MKTIQINSRQFPNALHVQCMTEIGDWAPKHPDLATVGIGNWVDGLTRKNGEFETLARQYHAEKTDKPEFNMRDSRNGIEPTLSTLFGFIEVLDLMEGEGKYSSAIHSLNTIIKHYNDIYAQHKGAINAGATTTDDAKPTTSENND